MKVVSEDDMVTVQRQLVFKDDQLAQNTLVGLDLMRRNGQFCDVVLQVENTEIPAHRAVLASASSYLFEWFNTDDGKTGEKTIKYHLNGQLSRASIQALVDYAYTARLEIDDSMVQGVYLAACLWKMEKVRRECAKYLLQNLCDDNCLQLRSLLSPSRDDDLTEQVDKYINHRIQSLTDKKELQSLSRISVEILNISNDELPMANGPLVTSMVLDWIRNQVEGQEFNLELFTEKNHLLYLNEENILQDCSETQNSLIAGLEIVQDYKSMSKRLSKPPSKGRKISLPSKPRHMLYSRKISNDVFMDGLDKRFKMIAAADLCESNILSIVTVNGILCTLSIKPRTNPSCTSSPVGTPPERRSRPSSLDKADCYQLLARMGNAKCALGAAAMDDRIFVCGGYDRGECLKTGEIFDPATNTWSPLASMSRPRARFDLTVVNNKAYAVGGCNGSKDLSSMEVYDSSSGTWKKMASLSEVRSSPGVCALNGEVYCIGGQVYQRGSPTCEKYNEETNTWSLIASLNTGRYQAAVTSLNGEVYVVGGCESWNCLATVEVYNPESNTWRFISPMITARRGCGAIVYKDKLWVIGGSDGSQSLCTAEVYDPATNTWTPAPNMTTCRANVSAVVVKDMLFAVGGYSGKAFLNTLEYYSESAGGWTTFIPVGVPVPETPSTQEKPLWNGECSKLSEITLKPDTLECNGHTNGYSSSSSEDANKVDSSCGGGACIGL